MSTADGTNDVGHGHVYQRPDGIRMRCGGPGLCKECSIDQSRKNRSVLSYTREGAQRWRDDALDAAAAMVERHFGNDAAACVADIRALKEKDHTCSH